jgi:flagellar biosynthesis/type III secretory pathway protein FliH
MTSFDPSSVNHAPPSDFLEGGPFPHYGDGFSKPAGPQDGSGPETDVSIAGQSQLLEQQLKDSFAAGFAEGKAAAKTEILDTQKDQDNLADAVDRLKPADTKQIALSFLETLKKLLVEAIGATLIDEKLFLSRCEEAVELIGTNLDGAVLHIAPSDADILQNAEIAVELYVDPDITPGSIYLTHRDGEILSGSCAAIRSIENKIEQAGGSIC